MSDPRKKLLRADAYPVLSELLGAKLYSRITDTLLANDSSEHLGGARTLLEMCDHFLEFHDITAVSVKNDDAKKEIFDNVSELIRLKAFLKLASIYGRRTSTVLSKMTRGLLEMAAKNPDGAQRCAKIFAQDAFRHFISSMFSAVKNSIIRELIECFALIAASAHPECSETFAAFLCSDRYIAFMKRYACYLSVLSGFTHRSALLLINYPTRSEFRQLITEVADTDTFFGWTGLFEGLSYREPDSRRCYDANDYLSWLFYYIFLLGKWDPELRRALDSIMKPDITRSIKGGRHGALKGIVNLVNAAVFFQDSTVFVRYTEFYCAYNTRDEVRQEIFAIAADIAFAGGLKPQRRKDFFSFFLSPPFKALFKELRQSSVDTLIFLTHVSAFSLRYDMGEFFKAIDENRLLDLLLSLSRRDRLFRNYLQLFTYIEHNLESRTLRMRLIIYFYFHFSQIAAGKKHADTVYLTPRHREFTRTLMERNLRASEDPWFKVKHKGKDEEEATVTWVASGKKNRELGESWFFRDKDMDRAVFLLRLDVIMGIMGQRRLSKEEHAACSYLLDLAGNLKMEDGLYTALPSVIANDDLIDYYLFIRERFEKSPFSIGDFLTERGFYRVYFREHRIYILRMLLPVLGLIPVVESEWAKTDNRNIYLPPFIHEFDDRVRRDRLFENRNIGLYLYLGLHEFSHWFANSFEFDDRQYLIDHTSNPGTAFSILNIIEDFRSEALLLSASCSENYRTIITEGRKHYALFRALHGDTGSKFFAIVMLELYWESAAAEALPELADEIRAFESAPVSDEELGGKGIFSIRDLLDRVIGSIRSMPVSSSRHSILLAAEVFSMLNRVINLERLEVRTPGMEHTPSGEKRLEDAEPLPDAGEGKAEKSRRELSPEEELERKRRLSELYDSLEKEDIQESESPTHNELVDRSTRTRADNDAAERTLCAARNQPFLLPGNVSAQCSEEAREREERRRLKAENARKHPDLSVLSYNRRVGGYTDLREIQVYNLSGRSPEFARAVHPYRYVVERLSEEIVKAAPKTAGSLSFSESEGELDPERFIEAMASRASGSGRTDLFRCTARDSFDHIGVYIGLDVSGSTENDAGSGLRVIDVERIFAWILGSAFSAIGAHVVFRAFNSMSSTNVYRLSDADALSALSPNSGNRDGDFIRYMIKEMERDGFRRRYFFMLSDGAPNAPNYDGEDAVADTAMAMNEAVRSGAQLIYFNVDPLCSDYFGVFSSQATYAENFANPAELIGKAREMVLSIVAGEV